MLRQGPLLLAFAIMVGMLGSSLGQSPVPRPDSQPAQQRPNAEQRGSEQAPFIVQLQIPAQIVQGKPDTKTTTPGVADSDWFSWVKSWNLSDKIAALALLAFGLQAWFMGVSARQTRRTTNDQLAFGHKIERAYMSAGGVPARRRELVQGTLTPVVERLVLSGDFELHVNNHGKTPGELEQIAIGFCDASNIPEQPVYEPESFHDWIGPGTQSRPMRWIPIPKDKPASAVYGRLYYKDIFGEDHSSGFIQSILPNGDSKPLFAPAAYTESH